MAEKVMIKNNVNAQVSISIPELKLKRSWEKKGVQKAIDLEVLKEAVYDPGVEYMFKEGVLSADERIMKELGFTEEGFGETSKILNDFQRNRYMTVMPLNEFKKEVSELSYEQIMELAEFAIENGYTDIDKSNYIKSIVGRDIVKTTLLEKEAQED